MYDALCMHVSQRIDKVGDRAKDISRWQPRKHAEIRAIDELLTEESRVRCRMEFESTDDMRVHHADAGLPLRSQPAGLIRISR